VKLATITTALMTTLLMACGDGVTIGNQNSALVNDIPATESPFAVSTPANNPAGSPNPTEPNAPAGDVVIQTPAPDAAPAPTGARMIGFVNVNQIAASATSFASGTFLVVPATSTSADLIGIFVDPDEDACQVFSDDTDDDVTANSASISAGEVLTLTSPAGTFSELAREISDGETSYAPTQGFISGTLPASLTLDIPGDVFPAFPNIAVPVVQALNAISPVAGQTVNTGTTFSWVAGNNPNAYIEIFATDSNNGSNTTVSCTVRDDGSFTFSTATANELGTSFAAQFFAMTREAQVSANSGNALLIVSSSSE